MKPHGYVSHYHCVLCWRVYVKKFTELRQRLRKEIYQWLRDLDVLAYNPNHDIWNQIEGRRQLIFQIMELIEEGKKGEKKAVEVIA